MNVKHDYINKINFLALIFISIYTISYVGYDIHSSDKFIYVIIRLITNLGFPLLLMTFGAYMLKNYDGFSFVKKSYKSLIPSFVAWNIVLGIIIAYFNGFYFFITILTQTNWFLWIVLSNILVVPILAEFIHYESENGMKYLLALFFIASILFSLSIQFNFSLYYIDIVFFAQPLCFMVLGYYLDNKEFDGKIFIISLIILLVTLSLRILLITNGIAKWNCYFSQIFGNLLQISIDPFTIIEVSAIFLMFKSLNGFLSNNSLINFYSKKSFSLILILGILSFTLSKLAFNLSWFELAIYSTLFLFVAGGIFLFVVDKIPVLNKFL